MNPADIQRLLLGFAVFAMGYLLILQWQEDYGGPPVSVPDPEYQSDLAAPQAAPQTAGGTQRNPVSDAPSTPLPGGSDTAPASEVHAAPLDSGAAPALIRVTTDTFHAWIDPRGGNLVRLTLPRYPLSMDQPDTPLPLLERNAERVYVAQSGLVGPDGPDANGTPPLYASSAQSYSLDGAARLEVPLVYERDGMRYVKRYIFSRDSYEVGLQFDVTNLRDAPAQAALYAQIKRDAERPTGEVTVTLGPHPYLGGAISLPDDPYARIKFDDIDEEPFSARAPGGWIAMVQHYFVTAWIPPADGEYRYYGEKLHDGTYRLGLIGALQTIGPGATGTFEATLYAGPKIKKQLDAAAPHLGLTVDYGILYWVAEPMFWLLSFIHGLVGNWGVAIILLTVVIKALLYPLSEASFRSMANLKRVAPEMKRLQERYSDDRQKLSQAMMDLYKREKVNPLGGCLPIVMQMPVFISLYWVLYEAVELRQAPFILWIDDLSVMDPYFVLPILMGASMYVTQLLNPPPPDPVQAQVMRIMPFMFTFLFLFFPAGLVLYWLVNNILSIAQQWLVNKRVASASAAV